MDMNIEKDEIFIKVKGIGFVFLLDKRMKHNLISPAFLAFFDFGKRPMYSLPESNIREVNTNYHLVLEQVMLVEALEVLIEGS